MQREFLNALALPDGKSILHASHDQQIERLSFMPRVLVTTVVYPHLHRIQQISR